jgi:hypothetical protein
MIHWSLKTWPCCSTQSQKDMGTNHETFWSFYNKVHGNSLVWFHKMRCANKWMVNEPNIHVIDQM